MFACFGRFQPLKQGASGGYFSVCPHARLLLRFFGVVSILRAAYGTPQRNFKGVATLVPRPKICPIRQVSLFEAGGAAFVSVCPHARLLFCCLAAFQFRAINPMAHCAD